MNGIIDNSKLQVVVIFLFIIAVSLLFVPTAMADSGIDLTNETEIALSSMEVNIEPIEEDLNNRGYGQVRYNITVNGEIPESGLPLQYPVRVSIYDLSNYEGPYDIASVRASSDAIQLSSQRTVLNPTQPDEFVPSISQSNDRERVMSREFESNIAFKDLLNKDENVTKEVGVFVNSIRSVDTAYTTDTVDVKGPLPAGVSSSTIQRNEDQNILAEISFVDEYRITESGNPKFGENMNIPTPTDSKLKGDITRFESMKSPFGEASVISGEDGISFLTRTIGLPAGRPYTVTISYTIPEGGEVYVDPLNPVGQDILEETQYRLPSDPSEEEYCRGVNTENGTVNFCTLYLNEGEVDSIAGVSESILHYRSDESTTISINCQSIISGYLPNNRANCGVNPSEGGVTEPVASAILESQGQSNTTNEGGWSSNRVNVLEDPDGNTDHYIRYNISSTINSTLQSGDYEIRIYNDSHISDNGEIISGSKPVYQNIISDYNNTWNNQIVIENQSVQNLSTQYHILLCQADLDVPSECGIQYNTDYEDIVFTTPRTPGINLDITSPVLVKPLLIDRVEEDAIDVRTKVVETPDENYDEGTDWNKLNDGDPVIQNFSGVVRQEVTVDDIYEYELDNLTDPSSEIFQEAVEKRADGVPENLWEYDVSVSKVETKQISIPESRDLSDYVSTDIVQWSSSERLIERTVQIGKERESFPIVSGDSFSAKVEGQERWYPLRETPTTEVTTDFVFDTRLQIEDPDKCLNCLPTESYGEAFDRLEDSKGDTTKPIGTSGFDAWTLVNNEDVIVNGREIAFNFFRRSEVSGTTIAYRNIDPLNDNYKYRHRQSTKINKRLNLWEYSNNIVEPTFERPLIEPVERYTRDKYEVTYNFEADLQDNTDIYRYEKTIRENLTIYEDGHIAWIDLSDSEPTDEIDQFEVKFEGAEESIRVDWIDEIHTVPPQKRDARIANYCDEDLSEIGDFDNTRNYPVSLNESAGDLDKLQYISGLRKGVGGTPVVQKCTHNGEEKIVRIGQQYEEPGTFNYEVSLVSADKTTKGTVEVIPKRENEPPKDPTSGSEPIITNFDAVNDKVDYRIGTVALEGTILSQAYRLDSPYEVTITPADNIDASSVSCGELGGNYKTIKNRTLTQTYESGASFREVEKCVLEGFKQPSKAPQSFELQSVVYQYVNIPGVGEEPRVISEQANNIPRWAIQECRDPLIEDDSGQCIAPEELDGLNQDNEIEFGSQGSYNSVQRVNSTIPPLGQSCPYMYESNVEVDEDSGTDQFTVITNCELQNPEAISIDLRSRTVSYQYESVQSGVVEECSEIPTVPQEGTHSGYEDKYSSSDTRGECRLVDPADPGPTPFNLYNTEYNSNTGQAETEYQDLPAGAFRPTSFITGEKSDQCSEIRIEGDGGMICDYKEGEDETTSVRFATRERGIWTSTSDTVSNILDQTNSRKTVWSGRNIIPTENRETYQENFTTTINPRNLGVPISKDKIEFTIELRNRSSGNIIQEENVEVQLCAAGRTTERDNLPREYMGPYECENFDTMLTGENDFQGGRTVDDAISEYASVEDLSSRNSVNYTINAVTNDACPYTHEFPRDQQSLLNNPETYTFAINADNTTQLRQEEERIRDELNDILASQYSPLGDNPCQRFNKPIDENLPTMVRETGNFTIEFNKNSFTDNSVQNYTRVAGLEDLHMITENPVQSRWEKGDLGSGVRLGTPILLKFSPTLSQYASGQMPELYSENKGLLTHYTFDHSPTKQLQFTTHTGQRAQTGKSTTTAVTVPNHFVIQDVGMPPVPTAPDGTERDFTVEKFKTNASDPIQSPGIYNARIWHGAPCHAESRYDDGRIFNPTSIQPIKDNIGPTVNSQALTSEPCEDLLTSEEATEIAEYAFVSNKQYNQDTSPYPIVEDRLNNTVPTNQSAYLPIKPTKDWKDEYAVNEGNKIIKDAYKSVQDNYAEGQGVFGGNALRLEDTSWLMITPPCHNRNAIGDDIDSTFSDTLVTGSQGSCEPDNSVSENDPNWRGGWKNSYTYNETQFEGSNIHKEIDESYTVSFWINTESERSSMDSVSADNGDPVSPLRTIFSTSSPVQDPSITTTRNPDIIPSTTELGLVKAPKYISLEDIPQSEIEDSDVLSGSFATPKSWDYPSHFNLRDTARSCITYNSNPEDIIPNYDGSSSIQLSGNQRPVMCEIFELSDSEYAEDYTDLTQYNQNDLSSELYEPPFMEDFRKEMVDRIVWETKLDWPVGPAIKRGPQRFPAFDTTQRFASQSSSPSGCYFATQRKQSPTGDSNCYENGRYVFSQGAPEYSGIGAEQTFKSSEWQHISISYDNSSTNEFSVYINGKQTVNVSEDQLYTNSDLAKDSVRIGKLYDNGVMSLGAAYQDPGYNMDPNNLSEEFTADFVPYIHSSKGEVLVDELRIYNQSLQKSQIREREIPEADLPGEHNIPVNVPMYTGTLKTDEVTSDANSQIIGDLFNENNTYRTYEVSVDASSKGPGGYKIDIIPCTINGCLNDTAISVSEIAMPEDMGGYNSSGSVKGTAEYSGKEFDTQGTQGTVGTNVSGISLSGTEQVIRFGREDLSQDQIANITSFRLEMELGSPYIDSTPIIRDIKIQPSGNPYSSCQEIAQNHRGSTGLYGSEFRMNLIDSEGSLSESKCDMRRAGGEWTQFAWVDVSDGPTFDKNTDPEDRFFMDDMNRSDCSLDDSVCFATADWKDNVINNVGSDSGPYPQIMIKAVDENNVVNWAAFELNPKAHEVIDEGYGVNTVPVARNITKVFTGEAGQVRGLGPNDYDGVPESFFRLTDDNADSAGLYPECLHPFDNDKDFDRRCISHIQSVNPQDAGYDSTRISMAQMHISSVTFGPSGGTFDAGKKHPGGLMVNITRKGDRITNIECLGENQVERCEFYYRSGSDFTPLTQQNGISSTQGEFDLDEYVLDRDSREVKNITSDARGYIFEPQAEIEIESLFSSYRENTSGSGDWWIGLYKMSGDTIDGDPIALEGSVPGGEFVENSIDSAETLKPGFEYAIVQGTTGNNSGNIIGYSPKALVDITQATYDHPIDTFHPTEQGYSFVFSNGTADPYSLNGETVDTSLSTITGEISLPRLGFEYDVVDSDVPDIQRDPAFGYISDFTGTKDAFVRDVSTQSLYHHTTDHSSTTDIQPDRTGGGVYFANSNGLIINAKYRDYTVSPVDSFDVNEGRADVVATTGLTPIEELKVGSNGRFGYVMSNDIVASYDLSNGVQRWDFTYNSTSTDPVEMSIGSDYVYTVNKNGNITQINKTTGNVTESIEINLEGESASEKVVHAFDANEEANKIVIVDGGESPKTLTIDALRSENDSYEPTKLADVDGLADISNADDGEVDIADDGRFAVWMMDNESLDGADITHGLATYDEDNNQIQQIQRYYIPNQESQDSQLINELSISPDGRTFIVGTDSDIRSAEVRTYHTNTGDLLYSASAGEGVSALSAFGKIR